MADYVAIYITASSEYEAGRIGRALVEERLAACVNMIPGMRSLYRWEGKIEEAQEVVLIAKTRAALVEDIEMRVKALHSSQCPCIVALPIEAGSPDFLEWIEQSTV